MSKTASGAALAKAYSLAEVASLIGKTSAQVNRLIHKGYLEVSPRFDALVVTEHQLSNYYLYGQFGRRHPSKMKKGKKYRRLA